MGDLDPEVSEVDLVAVFSEMGSLVSVRLCRDSLSGKSLCYAYVNFFNPSDGNTSLSLSLSIFLYLKFLGCGSCFMSILMVFFPCL